MSFIPGRNIPPGSSVVMTPGGIRIITLEGRMLGTNPNEAATVNPGGSQEALVWDPAKGDMVPMSSVGLPGGGGGRSGGHHGGWGGFGGGMGGGMDNIVQIMPGGGGMGGMGGGTLTINGVTYPPSGGSYGGGYRGGHGGHNGGHGGHRPTFSAPPVQITYPGGGYFGGWSGGHGGAFPSIGQLPPGVWARPVNPNDFTGRWGPNGRGPGGGRHPQPGHNNPGSRGPPTTSHSTGPSHNATVLKKLRDAPERFRKEDLAPDGKDCSICYRAFFSEEDGKLEIPVKLRTCPHIFGEDCINEWVQTSNKCPTCREEFPVLMKIEGQWVVFEPPREH